MTENAAITQEEFESVKGEKVVVLFTAETQDGKDFFCYVNLTIENLEKFGTMQAAGEHVDLLKLGEVVARGWGHEPSASMQAEIEEEYGNVIAGE
jgi:hypothetical protein